MGYMLWMISRGIVLLVATARMKYFSFNEQNANVNDITGMVRSSLEG